MKQYFIRILFQHYRHIDGIPYTAGETYQTERTVLVQANSALEAAHDGEHICNGYRIGTGLDAELTHVGQTNRGPYLESATDFRGAYPLNDN